MKFAIPFALILSAFAFAASAEETPQEPGPEQWRDVDPADLILIRSEERRVGKECRL